MTDQDIIFITILGPIALIVLGFAIYTAYESIQANYPAEPVDEKLTCKISLFNFPSFIGWVGSGFMVGFSFTLLIPLALVGLLCLTYQAMKNGTYNLVALNLVSIIGFTLSSL